MAASASFATLSARFVDLDFIVLGLLAKRAGALESHDSDSLDVSFSCSLLKIFEHAV